MRRYISRCLVVVRRCHRASKVKFRSNFTKYVSEALSPRPRSGHGLKKRPKILKPFVFGSLRSYYLFGKCHTTRCGTGSPLIIAPLAELYHHRQLILCIVQIFKSNHPTTTFPLVFLSLSLKNYGPRVV